MASTFVRVSGTSCSQATNFPLNPDFDLRDKLDALATFSPAARLHIMGNRYREGCTQAMLENKLLSNSLLHRLNIPTVRVLYGGFASHTLGEWPQYKSQDFAAALRSLIDAGKRQFVLKSATDGMGKNVLLMTADVWKAQKWTVEKVTQVADAMVSQNGSAWFTHWGQKFEHRGVLLQEPAFDLNLLLCAKLVHAWRMQLAGHRHAIRDTMNSTASDMCEAFAQRELPEQMDTVHRALMELKLHVAWGSLRGADGRVHIHPGASAGRRFFNPEVLLGDSARELQRCRWPFQNLSSRVAYLPSTGTAIPLDRGFIGVWPLPTCELIARMLNTGPVAQQLNDMASRIARATGADWFRLDVFASWYEALLPLQRPRRRILTGWCALCLHRLPNDQPPTLIVNELTYPSHNENYEVKYASTPNKKQDHFSRMPQKPKFGSLQHLVHGYRCRSRATVVGAMAASGVFQHFGIHDQAAFEASDYLSMRKPPAGFFDRASNRNGEWNGSTPRGHTVRS